MAKKSKSDGKVRVFLGTRKGGYVLESDKNRRKFDVKGPFSDGEEVYHVQPDPRTPGTVYAAVNNGWFGPRMFRSADWGRKWEEMPPPMMKVFKEREVQDFSQPRPTHPITNLWHVEPGPANEPKSVFLGIDPANLFRSDDRGASWEPLPGLNEHETRPKWNPGAGGMCLHTILIDPTRPSRMYVGISAAGTFRSDDSGEHWRPVNKGVQVSFQPEKFPEVGQCVHKIAMDPATPDTLYRQDHDGVYVSHNGMESWEHVGKPLGDDFGFVVTAPATMPGNAFFVPLKNMARTSPKGHLQVWKWTEKGKKWSKTVKPGQFPGEIGTHREALASDRMDAAGIYLGTTTGQLFFSRDGAKSWSMVPYDFPGIHSVEVSSPAA